MENRVASGGRIEKRAFLSREDDAISRRLVNARSCATPLPDFPGQLPDNLKRAYAIQDASIERWPDKVAGWKVAMLPEGDRARLAADRLAGPIFGSSVHTIAQSSFCSMPVYAGGFAAVEAEVVLELGVTVRPTGRDFSGEELSDMVAAAYCGTEVASSPMAVINERGPTAVVSDFGNNAGLLVGPEIPNWRSLPPGILSATVSIDDVQVGYATVGTILDGPVQALGFLVSLCANRGIELSEGTLVSAGAITGVHNMRTGSTAHIDFGSFGCFDILFEPMIPKP